MPPHIAVEEKEIGGTKGYIAGTLLLAPLVALIAIPMFIGLAGGVFGRPVNHDPVAVLRVLVVTLGAPLLIGMLINRFAPTAAARLVRPCKLLGTGLLVIVAITVLIVAFPAIRNAAGNGTLPVIVAIAAFGLLAGHLAGGPHPGNRRALALICSQRHPGVAMAIAVAAFPDDAQATLGAVVLYLVVSALIAVPYARWAAGAPERQS
jgi:BASS family bile acid:Na+ symporter